MECKIFLDTNIVIDIMTQRSDSYFSILLLKNSSLEKHISALTVPNVAYTVKDLNNDLFRNFLRAININPLDNEVIEIAFVLDQDVKDFDDSIQIASALRANCKYLITRDKKLLKSKINSLKIITPENFIKIN